jgi:hypothetical protein
MSIIETQSQSHHLAFLEYFTWTNCFR